MHFVANIKKYRVPAKYREQPVASSDTKHRLVAACATVDPRVITSGRIRRSSDFKVASMRTMRTRGRWNRVNIRRSIGREAIWKNDSDLEISKDHASTKNHHCHITAPSIPCNFCRQSTSISLKITEGRRMMAKYREIQNALKITIDPPVLPNTLLLNFHLSFDQYRAKGSKRNEILEIFLTVLYSRYVYSLIGLSFSTHRQTCKWWKNYRNDWTDIWPCWLRTATKNS